MGNDVIKTRVIPRKERLSWRVIFFTLSDILIIRRRKKGKKAIKCSLSFIVRKKILDDIKIESPSPLFKKLEDTVIEDENNRLMN